MRNGPNNTLPTGIQSLLEFIYIPLMAISLNLNSAYYYSFRNLSTIAYIIEIQKSKLVIFNSVNLTNLSEDAKLNSVYIFIL